MLNKLKAIQSDYSGNPYWAEPYRILGELLHMTDEEIAQLLESHLPPLGMGWEDDACGDVWLSTDGLYELAQHIPQGRGQSLIWALEQLD